jgi:putative restriction endonuclease
LDQPAFLLEYTSPEMLDRDDGIRAAALRYVQGLVHRYGPAVPWGLIDAGFEFQGQRILLHCQARGIFRPKEMKGSALSIKTSLPRDGFKARYDDELRADSDTFAYKYQDKGPTYRDNELLREAYRRQLPIIYFKAFVPGKYLVFAPCFVVGDHPESLVFDVAPEPISMALGVAAMEMGYQVREGASIERRYATTEAKVRLHQARFREVVLQAYRERCAICVLRERDLLDAAHIIPDRDERGVADVRNGMSLCSLHHQAFDHDLLAIRPDHVVVLSPKLLETEDGPMLENGLKAFHEKKLFLPRSMDDYPAPEFLEERWKRFEGQAG